MISSKISNYTTKNFNLNDAVGRHARDVDTDLRNIFYILQGQIRFGNGDDGESGENISGEFQQFISDATPDTEFSVTHTLGAIPIGYIIMGQDKAGNLYQLSTTGTSWTTTTVYLKCDTASVTFKIFLLK